jgi:hypothetical protein
LRSDMYNDTWYLCLPHNYYRSVTHIPDRARTVRIDFNSMAPSAGLDDHCTSACRHSPTVSFA